MNLEERVVASNACTRHQLVCRWSQVKDLIHGQHGLRLEDLLPDARSTTDYPSLPLKSIVHQDVRVARADGDIRCDGQRGERRLDLGICLKAKVGMRHHVHLQSD